MGKEVGNIAVVIVAADQLEDEVGLDQEDGEQDHNCCEAQKSKQDKKTFFPKEDLPGNFVSTRPKPAYGRQGLDWIVGPGYSFAVFSTVGQSDHFS